MAAIVNFNQCFVNESLRILFSIAQEVLTHKLVQSYQMCVVYLTPEKEADAEARGEISTWEQIEIKGKPYRFRIWTRGASKVLLVSSATLSKITPLATAPVVIEHTQRALVAFLKDSDYQAYHDRTSVAIQLKPAISERVISQEQKLSALQDQMAKLTAKISDITTQDF